MSGREERYRRNFKKTFELIELARALRIGAIRKKFPAMSSREAEQYFWREVRMIKDAMLDDAVIRHSSGERDE